jgi:hypothetical protein
MYTSVVKELAGSSTESQSEQALIAEASFFSGGF